MRFHFQNTLFRNSTQNIIKNYLPKNEHSEKIEIWILWSGCIHGVSGSGLDQCVLEVKSSLTPYKSRMDFFTKKLTEYFISKKKYTEVLFRIFLWFKMNDWTNASYRKYTVKPNIWLILFFSSSSIAQLFIEKFSIFRFLFCSFPASQFPASIIYLFQTV